MTITAPETSRDRLVIAREAGYKRLSPISVIAGVLLAYGAFAVFVTIAAGVFDATNTTTISDYDWDTVGVAGAAIMAACLFLAYLFGGYTAGRMARRAGVAQGLGVFVLGILAAVAIGFTVEAIAGQGTIADNLRDVGVPTTRDEWTSVGTIAGIASLAAIFLGSLLGGVLGDRWHSKLMARASDPTYGPEAELRREAAARDLDLRDREDVTVVRGTGDTEVVDRERTADNLPDEAQSGRQV